MENETFKSRVSNLLARTRKALRLYSSSSAYPSSYHAIGRNTLSNSISQISTSGSPLHKNQLHLSGLNNLKLNYSELQTVQWRDITSELLKELSAELQKPQSVKSLSAAIFTIRDKFNLLWRELETEIHLNHKKLMKSAESEDYVKSARLGTTLLILKARYQAAQAAHHELEELIKASHHTIQPIELTESIDFDNAQEEGSLKSKNIKHDKSVVNLPDIMNLHNNDQIKIPGSSKRTASASNSSKAAKVIPIRKVL